MNVALRPAWKKYVDKKIASKDYKDTEAVIEAGLRALKVQEVKEAKKVEELRQEIEICLDRAPATKPRTNHDAPMGREEFVRSLDESVASLNRGEGMVMRDRKLFGKAFIAEMQRRRGLKRGALKHTG